MTSLSRSRRGVLSRKTRVALVAAVASIGLVAPAVAPVGIASVPTAYAAEVKQLKDSDGIDFVVTPVHVTPQDRRGEFKVRTISYIRGFGFVPRTATWSIDPGALGGKFASNEFEPSMIRYELPENIAEGTYPVTVTLKLEGGRTISHDVPFVVSKDKKNDSPRPAITSYYHWQTDIVGTESRVAKPAAVFGVHNDFGYGEGDPERPVSAAFGQGAPADAKIDPGTGEVTYTLPADKDVVDIPVVLTYSDNTKDVTTARFTRAAAKNLYEPFCRNDEIIEGTDGLGVIWLMGSIYQSLPQFVTGFDVIESSVKGGTVEKRKVWRTYEGKPGFMLFPRLASGSDEVSYKVRVNYNDGTSVTTKCEHEKASGNSAEFSWDDQLVAGGQTAVSRIDQVGLPSNVEAFGGGSQRSLIKALVDHFELGADRPPASAGTVSVDRETGVVSFTPSENTRGTIEIPIDVYFKDGSVRKAEYDRQKAIFKVGPYAENVEPELSDSYVFVGRQVVFPILQAREFEDARYSSAIDIDGVTFEPAGGDWDVLQGKIINGYMWDVTIPDVPFGTEYTLRANAVFPDGTKKEVSKKLTLSRERSKEEEELQNAEIKFLYKEVSVPNGTGPVESELIVSIDGTYPVAVGGEAFGADIRISDKKGHNVTVDKKTGIVTLKPTPADANSTITIPLEFDATAMLNRTFTAEAVFKIGDTTEPQNDSDAQSHDAVGATAEVVAGETVTATVTVNNKPEGTKFTVSADSPTKDGVTVNKSTGKVTYTPAKDVFEGEHKVIVLVTYPDGSTDTAEVLFTVSVPKPDVDKYEPTADSVKTKPGAKAVSVVRVKDAPKGVKFAVSEKSSVKDGVTVDGSTGVVTLDVADGAETGSTISVAVTVTYPDGSSEDVDVVFAVAEAAVKPADKKDNEFYVPKPVKASGVAVAAGANGVATVSFDDPATDAVESVPQGTKFSLAADSPVADGVTVDESTGVVTFTPVKDAVAGTYKVKVAVAYPDKTTGEVEVPFRVTVDLSVSYATPVSTGGVTVVKPSGETPAGTVFGLAPGTPEGVSIDEDTGVVTVKHVAALQGKTVKVGVVLTNGDQTETRMVSVSVPAGETKPGDKAKPGDGQSKDGSSGGAGSAVIAIIPILLAILGIGGAAVMGMIPGVPAMKMPAMKLPGM